MINHELTLLIDIDKQWGSVVYKPVNDVAKIFAAIAGTETITKRTLKLAQELGYKVQATQKEFSV